jgi:hypothetical protein
MTQWQQILSAITGITFLVVLLCIALFVPNPTDFQIFIFRTVLGLAAGAFATIISGFINIDVLWKKFTLRAGAGLAVFVLIYMVNPPQLIKEYSSSKGFIPPETTRGGDKSAALVVPSDGTVLSLLPDKLLLDLQTEKDELDATVTTALSIQIKKNIQNPAESVLNHIRGAVYLSKNSSASITVNIGGRILQYEFPEGSNKPDMTLENDIYQTSDFFRQLTTPITWSGEKQESVQYPITVSIKASRQSQRDIALVAIDSLDAAVQFERRGQ